MDKGLTVRSSKEFRLKHTRRNQFKVGIACALLLSLLPACSKDTDRDGVPIVDIHGTIVSETSQKVVEHSKKWGVRVPSTRMITVKGHQMPLQEFLHTYCLGKFQNETCIRGSKIQGIDNSNGPVKDLPAGL